MATSSKTNAPLSTDNPFDFAGDDGLFDIKLPEIEYINLDVLPTLGKDNQLYNSEIIRALRDENFSTSSNNPGIKYYDNAANSKLILDLNRPVPKGLSNRPALLSMKAVDPVFKDSVSGGGGVIDTIGGGGGGVIVDGRGSVVGGIGGIGSGVIKVDNGDRVGDGDLRPGLDQPYEDPYVPSPGLDQPYEDPYVPSPGLDQPYEDPFFGENVDVDDSSDGDVGGGDVGDVGDDDLVSGGDVGDGDLVGGGDVDVGDLIGGGDVDVGDLIGGGDVGDGDVVVDNSNDATRDEIAELYDDILGREADLEGLAFWDETGLSADAIANELRASQEFLNLTNTGGGVGNNFNDATRNEIAELYNEILGREADLAGLAFWDKTGLSADAIANELRASQEFLDSMNTNVSQLRQLFF